MDLVSVIIPYYKKKSSILYSVNSVLNQTYTNFEIIIIYDDEDKSDLDFICELKKKDNRISIIQNNKNFGAGKSRNIGIKNAKGDLIAFLDADDIWHKEKLKKQIKFMKLNNYDITHTSYKVINENRDPIKRRIARNFIHINDLLKSCDIGTSTVIIKKHLIDENIKFAHLVTKEDFVLWLKLLKNNYKIYALDEVLTFWTKSNSSLSSSTFQKIKDGFKVYYEYMNFNYIKSIYYLLCLSINFLLKNK
tara:strand:- start:474 stop:1220 length:747 start_codon:yes stop_codon:yes gene_type:complete